MNKTYIKPLGAKAFFAITLFLSAQMAVFAKDSNINELKTKQEVDLLIRNSAEKDQLLDLFLKCAKAQPGKQNNLILYCAIMSAVSLKSLRNIDFKNSSKITSILDKNQNKLYTYSDYLIKKAPTEIYPYVARFYLLNYFWSKYDLPYVDSTTQVKRIEVTKRNTKTGKVIGKEYAKLYIPHGENPSVESQKKHLAKKLANLIAQDYDSYYIRCLYSTDSKEKLLLIDKANELDKQKLISSHTLRTKYYLLKRMGSPAEAQSVLEELKGYLDTTYGSVWTRSFLLKHPELRQVISN